MIDQADSQEGAPIPTLEDARRATEIFESNLPQKIQAAALTLHSKVPFKAWNLREALVHRVSSLASGAVSEFERGRPIPAAVLVRAVVETTAVLYTLVLRLTQAIKKKNDQELDDFLKRSLVGMKSGIDCLQAINVLTVVNHVEKEFPGFRQMFDNLCEFAHPNFPGTLCAFSDYNKDTRETRFGMFDHCSAKPAGLSALCAALAIAQHYYNQSSEPIRRLSEAFDSGEMSYDT